MASLYMYPEKLDSEGGHIEYPHYVTFTAIQKNKGAGTNETVALYLPAEAVKSSYTQTYGDTDLGAIGVAMDSASPADATALQDKIENMAKNAAGLNFLDTLSDVVGGIGAGAGLVGGLNLGGAIAQATVNDALNTAGGTKGQVVKALQQKHGKIMNPHKALLYSGPGGFRTFNFNYVMSPENKKEAESIASIVHFFKWHMHPGTPGGRTIQTVNDDAGGYGAEFKTIPNDISNSMSLTYPSEFQIKMFVNRKPMKALGGSNTNRASSTNPLFRIKNCFLESLNVDYATSGAPAFITSGQTSVPATTTMSLQFKETVLMTKTSIGKGF